MINFFLFLLRLLYESHLTNSNLSHEWSDYISPAKRPHHSLMLSTSALPHLINHPSLFEYQNGIHSHQEQMVSIQKARNVCAGGKRERKKKLFFWPSGGGAEVF